MIGQSEVRSFIMSWAASRPFLTDNCNEEFKVFFLKVTIQIVHYYSGLLLASIKLPITLWFSLNGDPPNINIKTWRAYFSWPTSKQDWFSFFHPPPHKKNHSDLPSFCFRYFHVKFLLHNLIINQIPTGPN